MTHRRAALAVLIAIILGGCARTRASSEGGAGAAPSFVRATVFFVPWTRTTAVALTPDMVRKAGAPPIVLDQTGVAALVRTLNLGALLPPSPGASSSGDFRLVVDLVRPDGTSETVAADRFQLLRLSDRASHTIDARVQDEIAQDIGRTE